jgi:hypothetical protein
MTDIIWVSRWVKLDPDRQLRTYTKDTTSPAWYYFLMFRAAVDLEYGFEIMLVQDDIDEPISRIRADMLGALIESVDLVGLEYRNEHGELIGIIQAISEPMGAEDLLAYSGNFRVHYTGGNISMLAFSDRLNLGHYVCLPGSSESGDDAMVEAFQARVEE